MRWTSLGTYYGLQRPRDFKVAIPFLVSIFGLVVVLIVSAYLCSNGRLSIGTERFYFFMYISVLFIIAAAFSRITIASLVILFWCATELSLALASSGLESLGIGASLFPRNWFTESFSSGFTYHPLLGLVPKPNWHGGARFDRRNKDVFDQEWPVNSAYYNEAAFSHNSLGLRGRELSANDLEKDLIFAVGGSSTYDWNVTQGSTWVERLESDLHNRVTIINFGVPMHSTVQHLIYTAFYQNILRKKPVCAIYYVGFNDLINLHVQDLDPAYANHLSLMMAIRKSEFWAAKYSPLVSFAYIVAQRRLDSIPDIPDRTAMTPPPGSQDRLERIFVENIRTIAAINSSRGVKTVFIGQMANKELLKLRSSDITTFSPFITAEQIWPILEHFNGLLRKTSASVGASYIDAGIGNFTNSDFADMVHFSAAGSRKFAGLISERVEWDCQ